MSAKLYKVKGHLEAQNLIGRKKILRRVMKEIEKYDCLVIVGIRAKNGLMEVNTTDRIGSYSIVGMLTRAIQLMLGVGAEVEDA